MQELPEILHDPTPCDGAASPSEASGDGSRNVGAKTLWLTASSSASVVIAGWILIRCWSLADGRGVGHEIPVDLAPPGGLVNRSGEAIDLPPKQGRALSDEEVLQLRDASRRVQRSLLCVGYSGHGFGSGFVISKRERLVATNAHVARIRDEAGFLYCRTLDCDYEYPVEKIWRHPMFESSLKRSTVITEIGNSPSILGIPSLDVAILELGKSGPDLLYECELADASAGESLLSGGAGVVYCSNDWLSGLEPSPGSSFGTIDRVLPFFVGGAGKQKTWKLMDVSVGLQPGASGSPIFLPNGDVVAISTWAWTRNNAGVALDAAILRDIILYNKISIKSC